MPQTDKAYSLDGALSTGRTREQSRTCAEPLWSRRLACRSHQNRRSGLLAQSGSLGIVRGFAERLGRYRSGFPSSASVPMVQTPSGRRPPWRNLACPSAKTMLKPPLWRYSG